ncbi:phosphotransferase [Aliikangiella coralliicola]|uniref:Uncharacterized protein n=1 Tax=Aliikangiella coralliicola TaxID=2592383 RepID=A0A545UHL2_9GAMM|nr:phosphotransferase [Aliikangiella coralliicola]TQV88903.1 hypothetical protein FLL46_05040 [Aliikangiella coralliicola]
MSNNITTDLQDKIKEAISQDLQLEEMPAIGARLIYSDDRKIYRISVEGEDQFYILKLRDLSAVKEGDLDEENISGEHEKLVNAWKNAKHLPVNYSMSKPVAIWLDHKAILMSGCVGDNLNNFFNQHILKWTFNNSQLKQRLSISGDWLGQYHQLAGKPQATADLANHRLSHVKRMLAIVEENSNTGLSSAELQDVCDKISLRFSQSTEDLSGHIHGNFAYRNILCNDDVINLVDFEDARHDLLAYDTGQFIAEIWFKSYLPWIRHTTHSLTNSFIKNYQKHVSLNQNTIDAFTAYHILVHLYEHSTRNPRGFAAVKLIKFRMNYLKKILKRWTSNPDQFLV